MVGIFDCGGVLGKYEIRLKERKVVNMEALNTYKTEKTLAEQMNERLAEMKMTKAEAALKMNYSRAALSQYLNGKYASDPTELACDMGLEIPKSHIYKKFNIPKPENGEEVLKPPQAGMMTAQQQPMETTEELKLKQEEGQAEQRQVDTIVSIANKQSEDIFREMMKPIFKMIDKAEDMDELQKVLKDEKKLRELYQDMESPELEDLIQQGIYLSHLIGRSMD